MLKNYFKIAWRNIVRNRFSSAINIGGLAVGIAVAILIGLWMYDELSFDKQHKNYNRIAQVKQHVINNDQLGTGNTVPYPLAAELRKHYGSDFKHVILQASRGEHIIGVGDKRLVKEGAYYEPEHSPLRAQGKRSGYPQSDRVTTFATDLPVFL